MKKILKFETEYKTIIDKAYFEGYRYLDSLEDYWYEITIKENDIIVKDLDYGGNVDEIKKLIKTYIDKDVEYLYIKSHNYESDRVNIITQTIFQEDPDNEGFIL